MARPSSGEAAPAPATANPAPTRKPSTATRMSTPAALDTSPAARNRSCASLARLRTGAPARPKATATLNAGVSGASHTIRAAMGVKTAMMAKEVRYRLAKWLAIPSGVRSAAQNRAIDASSQLKVTVWARVVTENARA